MNINSDERRIGLSIKRLDMDDEQSILSEYIDNMKPPTSAFGEILRENLQEKLKGGEDVAEAQPEAEEEAEAAVAPDQDEEA